MCLCFGLGLALRVFTKLLKIPISEKDQYQSDNIFGRYIDFESHNTTDSHEPRLHHMSPAKCGLYNKHKDSNFALMSENKNSGNGDRFNQNDFAINTRELKAQKVVKICQDLLRRVILRLFWTGPGLWVSYHLQYKQWNLQRFSDDFFNNKKLWV